jgi:hypothetical protein
LLTTGKLPAHALDAYAEAQLANTVGPLSADALLPAFSEAKVRSTPYALARDISGEETLALIEADPMGGTPPDPIMRDIMWLQLQAICEK